jgi:hypothetical protein
MGHYGSLDGDLFDLQLRTLNNNIDYLGRYLFRSIDIYLGKDIFMD